MPIDSPKDLARLRALFRTYLRPYWRSGSVLLTSYFLVSILTSVQPLLMAPILEVVVGGGARAVRGPGAPDAAPATAAAAQGADAAGEGAAGSPLDLDHLGEHLMQWLGLAEMSAWQVVLLLAGAWLAVAVVRQVLVFANYLLALWIRVRASRDMQQDLFRHLLTLSLDFFHRRRTGELISRLDRDTTATVSALEPVVSTLVVASLQVLIFGVLLFKTNFRLTLLVLLAGALQYGLTRAIREPIKRRVRDQFNVLAEATAYLQEVILSVRVVKSFAAERFEADRLRRLIDRVIGVNMRWGVFKHVHEPANGTISALINVGILLLTAHELFAGRLTTVGFFLYLYLGRAIVEPIGALSQVYHMSNQMLATGERVRDLFAEQPSVRSGARPVVEFRDALELKAVRFAYDDEPVLRDIDLTVRRGEVVALVGPSGAGKSTLTDLVLRFYDPQQGALLLDGVDLRELELTSYRDLFGVVAQESLLFNATVAENIAYSAAGVDRADVEEAARIANAHDFIVSLPAGYDTPIGDRGVRLSGGQRQRLAIARAVIRKPEILILDEATSALDSESERQVQEAIEAVTEQTTAIIIAHRLSTVAHADKIVVLDQGRIIDQGTHGELFVRCSLYRYLYKLQFGRETAPTNGEPTAAAGAAEGVGGRGVDGA